MGVTRSRVTTDDLTEWINEGFLKINRPPDHDPYAALKSKKVRMSTVTGVCKRKGHYGERYPELDMPDPTDEKQMSGTYRMVFGTLVHEGDYLEHKGEIKELSLDVDNITGHCDIYLPKEGIVIDIKTTKWIPDDPHPHHVEQVEGYYCQLNKTGHPCYQLFLFYINLCRAEIRLIEIIEKPLDNQPIEPYQFADTVDRNVVVRNKTIDEIWEEICKTRDVMLKARKEGILPEPVNSDPQRKGHWLCERYCAFKSRCIMNSL